VELLLSRRVTRDMLFGPCRCRAEIHICCRRGTSPCVRSLRIGALQPFGKLTFVRVRSTDGHEED